MSDKLQVILNLALLGLTVGLTIAVVTMPWHAGAIHSLINGLSLALLFFSYRKNQSQEIRTLLRIGIAIGFICLAVATPVAYS
ncbi:MAG: hypothetical protein MI867_13285 [Pseudomonadales bacterium]|nr:hypothetical protein [Pseudomonadales bacterium]